MSYYKVSVSTCNLIFTIFHVHISVQIYSNGNFKKNKQLKHTFFHKYQPWVVERKQLLVCL